MPEVCDIARQQVKRLIRNSIKVCVGQLASLASGQEPAQADQNTQSKAISMRLPSTSVIPLAKILSRPVTSSSPGTVWCGSVPAGPDPGLRPIGLARPRDVRDQGTQQPAVPGSRSRGCHSAGRLAAILGRLSRPGQARHGRKCGAGGLKSCSASASALSLASNRGFWVRDQPVLHLDLAECPLAAAGPRSVPAHLPAWRPDGAVVVADDLFRGVQREPDRLGRERVQQHPDASDGGPDLDIGVDDRHCAVANEPDGRRGAQLAALGGKPAWPPAASPPECVTLPGSSWASGPEPASR